jgi:hypothetical protein
LPTPQSAVDEQLVAKLPQTERPAGQDLQVPLSQNKPFEQSVVARQRAPRRPLLSQATNSANSARL